MFPPPETYSREKKTGAMNGGALARLRWLTLVLVIFVSSNSVEAAKGEGDAGGGGKVWLIADPGSKPVCFNVPFPSRSTVSVYYELTGRAGASLTLASEQFGIWDGSGAESSTHNDWKLNDDTLEGVISFETLSSKSQLCLSHQSGEAVGVSLTLKGGKDAGLSKVNVNAAGILSSTVSSLLTRASNQLQRTTHLSAEQNSLINDAASIHASCAYWKFFRVLALLTSSAVVTKVLTDYAITNRDKRMS